jgi:hypothetical protein
MPFSGKWMEPEIIMLSKIRQTQKNIACFLSYAESRSKNKQTEDLSPKGGN